MIKIFNFQFPIFNKIRSFWKKPKVVIATGDDRKPTFEAISRVLKNHFDVGKEILIFESELKDKGEINKIKDFTKKSQLAILVVTQTGHISEDGTFFLGEEEKITGARELMRSLPGENHLVLNFDDETVKTLRVGSSARIFTFGLKEGASFLASDIKVNDGANPVRESGDANQIEESEFSNGVNFKVNYEGNTVPVWLENKGGKEQIYAALAAITIGTVLGLNLVEISQALKETEWVEKTP